MIYNFTMLVFIFFITDQKNNSFPIENLGLPAPSLRKQAKGATLSRRPEPSGDWSGVPGWTGSEIGLEAPVLTGLGGNQELRSLRSRVWLRGHSQGELLPPAHPPEMLSFQHLFFFNIYLFI